MALTGKQRRELRAQGHHLQPVVLLGAKGLTDAVVAAVEQALHDHELIKIKVNEGPQDRHEVSDELAARTGAEVAQVLGNTVLLYKKRPPKPPAAAAKRSAPRRNTRKAPPRRAPRAAPARRTTSRRPPRRN